MSDKESGMNIAELSKEEVTIEGVHFYFGRPPHTVAVQVINRTREELHDQFDTIRNVLTSEVKPTAKDNDGKTVVDTETVLAIAEAVLGLSTEFVEYLQGRMFQHVMYSTPKNKVPARLAGDEDTAFASLTFMDIYEVLLRSIVVGFIVPLQEWRSRRSGAGSRTS